MTKPSLFRMMLLSSIVADLVLVVLAYLEINALAFYGWLIAAMMSACCYALSHDVEEWENRMRQILRNREARHD